MTEVELEILFDMMGSKLTKSGTNRSARCPLAAWTHPKGVDKSPSLTAKAGDVSLFKCWSCSTQGSVRKLAKLYGSNSGDHRPYQYVCSIEGEKADCLGMVINAGKRGHGAYSKKYGGKIKEELKNRITEEVIQKFCEEIPNYAFERGITKEQIIRWEIGYDPVEKRAIFTIRDHMGKLMGVSGRDLTGLKDNKYKHYPGLRKEFVLYGERFLDRSVRRTHIVEGFMDVLGMERQGFKNVFASMGTSLSFDHLKKIKDWSDEVIFLPDGDMAGLRFAQEQAQRIYIQLGKKSGVAGVRVNPEYIHRENISGKWNPSDYRFCFLNPFIGKDPDDWSRDDINLAFANVGEFVIGKGGLDVGVRGWVQG